MFSLPSNRNAQVLCLDPLSALKIKFESALLAKGITSPIIGRRKLYFRVKMKNGQNSYNNIVMGENQTAQVGEVRMMKGELYAPIATLFGIANYNVDTDVSTFPSFFADPGVFKDDPAAPAVAQVESLKSVFNHGHVTVKSGNIAVINELDTTDYRNVANRPYTPTGVSGASYDMVSETPCCTPWRPLINDCVLEGSDNNTFSVQLGPGNWSNLEGGNDDSSIKTEIVFGIDTLYYYGITKSGDSCPIN